MKSQFELNVLALTCYYAVCGEYSAASSFRDFSASRDSVRVHHQWAMHVSHDR
jgi:hypothetical protein